MRRFYLLFLLPVVVGCATTAYNIANKYPPSPAYELFRKAWDELGKNNFSEVEGIADECINLYADQAKQQNAFCLKNGFDRSNDCNLLNDVSGCMFFKFLVQRKNNQSQDSETTCGVLNVWYFNGFIWPPGECYGWVPAEACRNEIMRSLGSNGI